MARISTYPIDTKLSVNDKWIGTDTDNKNKTKNFSLESVIEFINVNAVIESQTLRYKFLADAVDGKRTSGSISTPLDAGDAKFSDVTSIALSSYSLKYVSQGAVMDVSSWYTNPLVGSYVLITDVKDVSTFAIYTWNSAAARAGENGFWDIGLKLEASKGSFENSKDYFISLLQYDVSASSGDKTEVFTQGVASNVWNISHSLNKFASVSIVDSAGTTVYGNVDYKSASSITVTFANAFAGKAFLN